jgi:peptide/nickel transport system ATP-binding protein
MTSPFISIENLVVSFSTSRGIVKANEGISLEIYEGEILGLIGETGCGKTTLGKALLGLLSGKVNLEGKIVYRGRNLLTLSEKEMRNLRGKEIGLMFQNPSVCLNPVLSVGKQIAEIYRYHEGMGKKEAEKKAREMLELVGINSSRGCEYPHQFSGGMLQRVMVATGLALRPKLLIADEPTKGLDPETKTQIIDIIVGLVKRDNSSMLLITHDLILAGRFADRIAVMYAGEIVEVGEAARVISDPKHPYTFDLLHSLPEKGQDSFSGKSSNFVFSSGSVSTPAGCRYYPRCRFRLDLCLRFHPDLMSLEEKSLTRCLLRGKGKIDKKNAKTAFSIQSVLTKPVFTEKPAFEFKEE